MTIKWNERSAPELFNFDKKDIPITGRLIAAGFVEIEDKETKQRKSVLEYIIENEEGTRRIKLLATADLAQKLGKTDVGRLVRITWTGSNEQAGKGGNAMKVFKVEIAEEAAA